MRALADYPDADVAAILIDRLPRLTPEVRSAAVEALLAREPWTLAMLRAARAAGGAAPPIESSRKALLLGHKNPEIAALAKELLGAQASTARDRVLADYASALKLPASERRGADLFGRHCTTCHRLGNRGHAVGPDLSASPYRDPADLLTHILDPNRNVPPNYVQYVLADRGGRVFTGIIAAETATSLTLRRGEGLEETILRSQVEELTSTGKSLMPEGFEREIKRQDMADLIAYLTASRRERPEAGTGLEIGTLPGPVEPEK